MPRKPYKPDTDEGVAVMLSTFDANIAQFASKYHITTEEMLRVHNEATMNHEATMKPTQEAKMNLTQSSFLEVFPLYRLSPITRSPSSLTSLRYGSVALCFGINQRSIDSNG